VWRGIIAAARIKGPRPWPRRETYSSGVAQHRTYRGSKVSALVQEVRREEGSSSVCNEMSVELLNLLQNLPLTCLSPFRRPRRSLRRLLGRTRRRAHSLGRSERRTSSAQRRIGDQAAPTGVAVGGASGRGLFACLCVSFRRIHSCWMELN
jgi:hypothetical protein